MEKTALLNIRIENPREMLQVAEVCQDYIQAILPNEYYFVAIIVGEKEKCYTLTALRLKARHHDFHSDTEVGIFSRRPQDPNSQYVIIKYSAYANKSNDIEYHYSDEISDEQALQHIEDIEERWRAFRYPPQPEAAPAPPSNAKHGVRTVEGTARVLERLLLDGGMIDKDYNKAKLAQFLAYLTGFSAEQTRQKLSGIVRQPSTPIRKEVEQAQKLLDTI